jgi:hypothetical protein
MVRKPREAEANGGTPLAARETRVLVRLRGRLHGGVKVPVRPKYHRPVTEGYCAVATRGGELPEVNCQSVTKHHRR